MLEAPVKLRSKGRTPTWGAYRAPGFDLYQGPARRAGAGLF